MLEAMTQPPSGRKRPIAHRLLASFSVSLTLLGGTFAVLDRFPAGQIVLSGDDAPGTPNGGAISDFAISPDDAKVTVGFLVAEGDRGLGVWLGEWQIATKKLIANAHLPNPVSIVSFFGAHQFRTMQYSRDGSVIFVETGHVLYALDSSSFSILYSKSFTDAASSTSESIGLQYAISGDGSTLMVLSGQSLYPNKLGSVHLYETASGNELAHWSANNHISAFSLSSDGTQALVTFLDLPNPADLLLLDSFSGRTIKTFITGFGGGSAQGTSEALFLGADRFVASPSGLIDAKGNYLGQALKVFDSRTGDVVTNLTYQKFGPTGQIWVSSDYSTIGMLNLWTSGFKRHFSAGEGVRGNEQMLFFHLNAAVPFCVLGPLPEKSNESPRQSGYIRFSPDLKELGLYMNKTVTLYPIGDCEERKAMQ